MINFIILLLFFVYNFSIFLVSKWSILLLIFIIQLIVLIIFKISIKKHIKFLSKNTLFMIFMILCNLLFSNINDSLLVGIRLFITIDGTYLIGNYLTPTRIREGFYYLFYPLKIFKVDIDSLVLSVAIAITFIPILSDEARMIKLSLRSKGFKYGFITLITKPHIYFVTYLNSLFDRIDELEYTMKVKAY